MKAGTQEHAAAQQRRNVHSESIRATEIGAAFVALQNKLDLEILEENDTSFRGSYDDEASQPGSHPSSLHGEESDRKHHNFEIPIMQRKPFENEIKKKESDDEEEEEIFSKYKRAKERARRQRKRERQVKAQTAAEGEILSSDEDDGHANSMGMQLLEYMKNPGTGWKSQEEQLQADFIGCYETPFELPDGEDMPALIPPPKFGSTISPWDLGEDKAKEKASNVQKQLRLRNSKVDRALKKIEEGEVELDLSHLHLDDEAALKCSDKLKSSFAMKKFNISLNHISLIGAKVLGADLSLLPKLTSLSFSHNSLGNEGAAALARCFHKSTVLTELNLDNNGIGPELPVEMLLLTGLKTLTLRQNKLETFPLEMLEAVRYVELSDNPAYLAMFLECQLEDEAEEAEKRSARCRTQHTLTLVWKAWENLDMPCAQDLLKKARKDAVVAGGGATECPSLVNLLNEAEAAISKRAEALGPSFVRVDDPAQIMTGNAIERASTKVREGGVDVSLLNQHVGDVGMTSMAQALLGNATVTWLDISGCDIGPKGLRALVPWIKHSPVLQTLWISSNPLIGDQGCTEIAEGLKCNTVLAKLDLTSCSIGPLGCKTLVKSVQANPSLRELRLALNKFGDEGATALAAALKDMLNLQDLDVSGCNIDSTGHAVMSREFKFHMGLLKGHFWR